MKKVNHFETVSYYILTMEIIGAPDAVWWFKDKSEAIRQTVLKMKNPLIKSVSIATHKELKSSTANEFYSDIVEEEKR